MEEQDLIGEILALGAHAAAVLPVAKIPFEPAFRKACEANSCGQYGRNWMCPPLAGDIHMLIEQAKSYDHALVYQTVGELEDSYDFEGMMEAGQKMNQLTQAARIAFAETLPGALFLGAGGCRVCERCAKLDEEPCRHPELALPSLETYGIAVSELASLCGLNYINGQNTVTYFGAVLIRE